MTSRKFTLRRFYINGTFDWPVNVIGPKGNRAGAIKLKVYVASMVIVVGAVPAQVIVMLDACPLRRLMLV